MTFVFQNVSTEQRYGYQAVIEDGRARVGVLPGSYSVSVQFEGSVGGFYLGDLHPGGGTADSSTIVMCQEPDEKLTVRAGETTPLSVQLPVYHTLRGSLRYAGGAPVRYGADLLVALHGLSDGRCSKGLRSDDDLHFFLPDGSAFSIEVWLGRTWLGWYGSDGLTTDPEAAATFTVDGEDLTLPAVTLPVTSRAE